MYYQGAIGFQPQVDEEIEDLIEQWRDLPVDQWPQEEVEDQLDAFANALRYVRLGTHCRSCDWGEPVEDGFDLTMPPLHDFRLMVKVMTLRTRLALEQGHWQQALMSLQDGLVMGANMDEGVMLVQSLVGMAIARVTLGELETWCQTPGTPNLYWALTALPDPLVSAADAYDYEQAMIVQTFPRLREIEKVVFTPAEALALARDIVNKIGGSQSYPQSWGSLASTGWVMIQYQDAKNWLAGKGWSKERIEALPAAQVVLIYQWHQYQRLYDDNIKGAYLPHEQGYPLLKRAEEELSQHYGKGFKMNLFMMYLPALYRINELEARLARTVAMWRVIEALRWYAADHEGELPRSLDQIPVVFIPVDPVSGKPFVYKCSDRQQGRLEAPISEGLNSRRPVYELMVKQ